MSTAAGANNFYFRRRTMGRAASPPTWACYEQIHDDYSDSDSCSEDDDDYNDDSRERDSDEERSPTSPDPRSPTDSDDMDMDLEDDGSAGVNRKDTEADKPKDIKGKQRAIEPEPESPRQQRKKRQHVYTLRPILTIQKSQGFVWNQVRFFKTSNRFLLSCILLDRIGLICASLYQG